MRGRWLRIAVLCVLAVMAGIAVWPWIETALGAVLDRDRVLAWLSGFGVWAPLAFIAISFIQVVIAPIPGQFIGVAGGYLFGVWAGLLYGLAGTTLGAGVNMWLGRRFGRPLVVRLAGVSALARFDQFADRRGAVFFFLIFLLPFVPDDLACYAIGLSPLPIVPMLVMATVVRLPAGMASVLVGEYFVALPPIVIVALLIGVIMVGALVWRYQERLETWLMRWIATLSPRRGAGRSRQSEHD